MNRKSKRERLQEILWVLARHGIRNGIQSATDPAKVRQALEELGPTFIKIGQILSMRRDILPESYLKELQKLQDNVKPENFEEIRKVVEDSLRCPLGQVFPVFEQNALASASLSEVHRARLADGTDVVVKIQRPRAKETMMTDLAILRLLSRLGFFLPQNNIISFRELVDEIYRTTVQELDFTVERQNIQRFGEHNKTVKYIACPTVYEQYSSSTILIMDYLEGIKIDDIERINSEGYDLDEIGAKLAENYLKQIFEDGFFHADPHPGNLMVCGNRIAFVDFGIMGSLDNLMKSRLDSLLLSLAANDVDEMTDAILRIGVKKGKIDRERLFAQVDAMFGKYRAATMDEISLPELFRDIFSVCRNNGIAIPREMTILCRGLLSIEGVLASIAPEMNLINTAANFARRRVLASVELRPDLTRMIEKAYLAYTTGSKVPLKLVDLLNSLVRGRFTLRFDFTRRRETLETLDHMVNRIVFGMIASAMIMGSSLVVFSNTGPKFHGVPLLGVAGYAGAGILGFWLMISMLRANKM